MRRIGVILNPNAGGNAAADEREAEFRAAVGPNGVVFQTRSLPQLTEAAMDLARRRIDVLAVCGGDGSFHHSLTACLRAFGEGPLPYFLPLPAGSMNTIASSLGWRRQSLARRLATAVTGELLGRYRIVERELICVNGTKFGFMVGAGVIVNFLSAYYGQRRRGPLGAAQLLGRLISSGVVGGELGRQLFASLDARVECDDNSLPWRRFNIIYASTVTELGLGFRIAYRAGSEPGRFHVMAGEPRLAQLIWKLPHLKQGWPTGAARLHDSVAASLRVELDSSSHYMIDGEILEPVDQLELNVGPRLSILI